MGLLSQIKLTKDDIRGVILLCVILAIVILIVAINRNDNIEEQKQATEVVAEEMEQRKPTSHPTIFDPNTVELKELLDIGFTKYEALSLLRYRANGKIFHIKEELIGCYGISDSLYFALEPYIVIGEEFRYKPKSEFKRDSLPKRALNRPAIAPSKFLVDTVGESYLTAIGALTVRQAEVFVRWRDMSGIHTFEELKACYVVSDSTANMLRPYAIFTPRPAKILSRKPASKPLINLNRADSATLDSIYGIGAKSAQAIIDYRTKLGGFYSKEQLSEIKIITESNFEKIITQIFVDSCDISKIDVNFASAKELSRHPYFTNLKIRRLLKIRQLKGGWSTIGELTEDDIFTKEEAQRVRPYLHFEVQ